MNASIRHRATSLIILGTAVTALAVALLTPGQASAYDPGAPWPEPPSCSNETFTCTSIEDMLAYECYFEIENSPFPFCKDPFELLQVDPANPLPLHLKADSGQPGTRLLIPATRN